MNKRKYNLKYLMAALVLMGAAFAVSLAVGRFPIIWQNVFSGDINSRVFFTLRLPRSCMAMLAGMALGLTGSVYQTVFQNALASPDIIGVSSGASFGAAVAILFFAGGVFLTALLAFGGGMAAVLLVLTLLSAARGKGRIGIVLAGIAVNALTQALVMLMKLTADPERQLAAIEFWTMGSFANVTMQKLVGVLPLIMLGTLCICLLHRQILLLGLGEDEAQMLGVSVSQMRRAVLLLATLVTSAVVSITGLISFIGLLAPHIARLITRSSRFSTMILSSVIGGALLLVADVLARSISGAEIPVSIITSLLGAPFLFWLMCRKGESDE